MGPALDVLRHVWISYFCSPIIQISSFITQIWWVPCMVCFFGFVFSFSFHRPKLTKMSDGWVRMKKKKKCFWVMEIKWWGHFCKYIHIVGPMVYVLSFLCHLTWLPNESMTFSSLIRYQIISFFFPSFYSLPKPLFSLHTHLPLTQPITLSILVCHSSWTQVFLLLCLCLGSGSHGSKLWVVISMAQMVESTELSLHLLRKIKFFFSLSLSCGCGV